MKMRSPAARRQTWMLFELCAGGLNRAKIEVEAGLRAGFLDRAERMELPQSADWNKLRAWVDARMGTRKEVPSAVESIRHGSAVTPPANPPPGPDESAGAAASVGPGAERLRSHFVIPDTQVAPGVPTEHLRWIGEYIVDRKPDVVVHLGDHWDMPSLSKYDGKGSRTMEGKRYELDVEAGNAALPLLRGPAARSGLRAEWHLLRGNHEQRVDTALEEDPRLEGTMSMKDLKSDGWEVHDFLAPVWIDGVCYSHYFYHPMTGRPWTGTLENRLKQIGHSFTMGHQQTLLSGMRFVGGKQHRGLIAGACYLHDEDYKGPQGNAHWRGIVCKHEVRDGQYDIMEVSLNYLCRRYEGMDLSTFMKKKGYAK